MIDLNKLSESELQAVLRFAQAMAGETGSKTANFFDMTEEESARQAEEQAKNLAARRNERGGGRVKLDIDPEDASIREQVRGWLKRTGRIKKYSVKE